MLSRKKKETELKINEKNSNILHGMTKLINKRGKNV